MAAALIGFTVGAILQLVPAIGQISAVGFREAWNRYHIDWFVFGLTAAAVMVGLLYAAVTVDRLYVWVNRRRAMRYSGVIGLLVAILLVGASVWAVGYDAYYDAQLNESPGDKPFLPQSVRSWLLSVLVDVDADRATLKGEEDKIAVFATQLAQSRERLAQLRELLGGAEPITKQDLAAAQTNGRIEGVILGIVTSVVASYISHGFHVRDQAPSERRAPANFSVRPRHG